MLPSRRPYLCTVWVTFMIVFAHQTLPATTITGTVDSKWLTKKQRKTADIYDDDMGTPAPPPKLRTAVVYLEGTFTESDFADVPKKAELVQEKLRFNPTILPIAIGTKVAFPNKDTTYHNVFSYSKAKPFDLGRYNNESEPQFVEFTKPGEVKVFCEIHDHMRSTILVLDTPYFATTDSEGKYKIENVRPGEYILKCWIRSRKVLEKKLTVKDEPTLVADFPK